MSVKEVVHPEVVALAVDAPEVLRVDVHQTIIIIILRHEGVPHLSLESTHSLTPTPPKPPPPAALTRHTTPSNSPFQAERGGASPSKSLPEETRHQLSSQRLQTAQRQSRRPAPVRIRRMRTILTFDQFISPWPVNDEMRQESREPFLLLLLNLPARGPKLSTD